ncbi:MAG: branched-chain amino acid ABC transporter permease, partial [Clostridium sp.]|nr:branched-chain amino acid ABC transporter permease [Clostridium sp.]
MSRKNKIVFLLALLLAAAVAPLIVTDNYNRGVFTIVLINVVSVLGLNFITGLTGQMNLGTAGIMAIGAYTSALLTVKMAFSPWITLLIYAGISLANGYGLGYPSHPVQGEY